MKLSANMWISDMPVNATHTTPDASTAPVPDCYVLVERSARLELYGYDSVVWHVALEACASSTQ